MPRLTRGAAPSRFRTFLLALVLSFGAGAAASAQTTLGPGDIAFTAYNSDNTGAPNGTGVDAFTFVLLVDVEAGTELTFTDNGWQAAGGFRSGETTLTWTADAGAPALAQVTISHTPLAASLGTLSGSGLNLSASGDQIFAYQGPPPTVGTDDAFVAALQMNGDWDDDAVSSTTTALPEALVDGEHALAITPEVDNAAYGCAAEGGSVDAVRASVLDPANWLTDNTAPFGQPRCAFGALPVAWTHLESRVEGEAVDLVWETASETRNAGFEIQHRPRSSSEMESGWSVVGFVGGAGTTVSPRVYGHRVRGLWPGRHAFRLKQVDFDGSAAYSPVVEVVVELDQKARLEGPFPHPVVDRSWVRLVVSHDQRVRLGLYDLHGRRAVVPFDGIVPAHDSRLLPLEAGGLPSGVYVLRAEGETFTRTRAVTIVR